jgi:hypothetical protein
MLNISTSDAPADTGARVGRKLLYPEKREVAFPPGMVDRIKAVVREPETVASLLRDVVVAEVEKREAVAEKLAREGGKEGEG